MPQTLNAGFEERVAPGPLREVVESQIDAEELLAQCGAVALVSGEEKRPQPDLGILDRCE